MFGLRQVAGNGALTIIAPRHPLRCLMLCILALGMTRSTSRAGEAFLGPHVTQFTPQGTVKHVRQVSVRFSEPMVSLGAPHSFVDPFEINCGIDGAGQWIDSRTWVYDFARDLPGGLGCRFKLRPGISPPGKQAAKRSDNLQLYDRWSTHPDFSSQ
jgi:hypothetical protein